MAKDLADRIHELSQVLPAYAEDLELALSYLESDPRGSLTKCRLGTERLIIDLYQDVLGQPPPQKGDPLDEKVIRRHLGPAILARLRMVREIANAASHVGDEVFTAEDADQGLDALCDVLEWRSQRVPRSGRRPIESGRHRQHVSGPGPQGDPREQSGPRYHRQGRRYATLLWGIAGIAALGAGLGLWALRLTIREIAYSAWNPSPSIAPALADAGSSSTLAGSSPSSRIEPVASADLGLAKRLIPPAPPVVTQPAAAAPARPLPVVRPGPAHVFWTRQQSPTQNTLYAAISDTAGQVFVAGAAGTLLVTRDGGTTWKPVQTRTKSSLFALTTTASGQVVAAGAQGVVLLPEAPGQDGSVAFRAHMLAKAAGAVLWTAHGHHNGDVFVGGDHGTLLQISGSGAFKNGRLPQPGVATVRSIAAWDEQTLYAVGDRGSFWRSKLRDGIATWEALANLESGTLWQIGRVRDELLVAGEYEVPRGDRREKRGLFLHGDVGQLVAERFLARPVNSIYGFAPLPTGEIFAAVYAAKAGAYHLRSSDFGAHWMRAESEGAMTDLQLAKYAIAANRLGDVFIVGPNGLILHKRVPANASP